MHDADDMSGDDGALIRAQEALRETQRQLHDAYRRLGKADELAAATEALVGWAL